MLDEGLYLPVRFYPSEEYQDLFLTQCKDVNHKEWVVASCSSLMPFQFAFNYDGSYYIDSANSTVSIVNVDTGIIRNLSPLFINTDFDIYYKAETAMQYFSYLAKRTDLALDSGLSYLMLEIRDEFSVHVIDAVSEVFMVSCECEGDVFGTEEKRRWAGQTDLRKVDANDLRLVKK